MKQILNNLITLTGYTDADAQILHGVAEKTVAWGPMIATAFYDTLYGYESTSPVFKKGERPTREKSLVHWYDMLIAGKVNDDFWQWQWYVGIVHIPRGISNSFMMGMMSSVQQMFLTQCMAAFEKEQALTVYGAFKRITDIVAGLIAESYFESYLEAVQRSTGLSRKLIDRQVSFAVEEMVAEAQKDRL